MGKSIINHFLKVPYLKGLYQIYKLGSVLKKNSCFPPGHYYSSIPVIEDIRKHESEIWKNSTVEGIAGLDLMIDDQVELIENLSKYYNEMPFKADKQKNLRYYFENEYYSYTDGIILYSMIRHLKPKQIIEIGSGFSSAVMLDVNEIFFQNQIRLTFIEPNSERLYSLFTEKDKHSVALVEMQVQYTETDIFKSLQEGDILFIDSSHVVKTGSDLNYILFEILPHLNRGVYIHFHDIFYPFEYPKEWIYGGRNWNEDYFLKAFLMYNTKFEIKLFSDFIHKFREEVFSNMPLAFKNTGGNLWIKKI